MKSDIIITPAVTETRTIMVPQTETVAVTPAVNEVTLTLNAKEAEHLLNILGARNGMDSSLGATGNASFERNVYRALNDFMDKVDPDQFRRRLDSAASKREEDRNSAFRRAGGYPNY